MAIKQTPYLHFVNTASEALEFYQSIFGGKIESWRFGDMQAMQAPEQFKDQIMHGSLMSDHVELFVSDSEVMGGVPQDGENISLSLSGYTEDEEKLREYFEALSQGGTITDELSTKPWGATFGMLKDKFGIHWMVNIQKEEIPRS